MRAMNAEAESLRGVCIRLVTKKRNWRKTVNKVTIMCQIFKEQLTIIYCRMVVVGAGAGCFVCGEHCLVLLRGSMCSISSDTVVVW